MKLRIKLPIIIVSITLSLFIIFSTFLLAQYKKEGVSGLKQTIQTELGTQAVRMERIFSENILSLKMTSFLIKQVSYVEESKRREYILSILKETLENNKGISAIWLMSTSNSIDSLDSKLQNTDLGDELGRFNPFLYFNDDALVIEQSNEEDFKEDYWLSPVATQKLYITDPYLYEYNGGSALMISFSLPVSKEIVIGFDLTIDNLVTSISSYKPYGEGYSFLLNDKGAFLSHPKKDIISKTIDIVDPEYNEKYRVLEKIMSHQKVEFEKYSTATKVMSYTLMLPFSILDSSSKWYVAFSVPLTVINNKINAVASLMGVFLIIAAVILTVSVLIISILLTRRITVLSRAFENISSGDADLTTRIDIKAKDELGDISKSFNLFLNKLRKIVSDTKNTQKELFSTAETLSALSEELAASTNQIDTTMNNVKKTTLEQVTGANESNATVHEIIRNIQNLNTKIILQKDSVNNSTANIEEMLSNMESIANMINNISLKFKELSEKTDLSDKALLNTLSKVDDIILLSETLTNANTMIKTIASRTSILAINAGIESAHAGEFGKGFKIIADEVRKLADDSSNESKVISNNILDIQKRIQEVKAMSLEVQESFVVTQNVLKETSKLENETSASLEEQRLASKDVLESLSKVNEITNEVINSFQEIVNGSSEIGKEMDNIIVLSNQVENSIKEISIGIKEINSSAQLVSENSSVSKQNATILKDNVDKFKV
jgi:methyl-accepting chemotaxis protein